MIKINEMSTSNSFLVNIVNGFIKRANKLFSSRYKKVNIGPIFLKYLKHIPPGKLHNHKLFGNKTWFKSGQEYLHGIDEIFIEEIYKQQLPENAFVLDCGANIGLSVIYLKKICPSAMIIAFEPDKLNFELLQMNIKSHGLEKVELKNEAVWKEDTMLNFESEGTMGSKIGSQEKGDNGNLVKAIRLKDYINRRIDFLKIDIEGAEFDVMMDIQDKLNFVDKLFVEYHGSFKQNNELTRLFDLFTEKGFNYYIKEATMVLETPFINNKSPEMSYDIQLNIFCFKSQANKNN